MIRPALHAITLLAALLPALIATPVGAGSPPDHQPPPSGRYEVVDDDDNDHAVESLVIDFSAVPGAEHTHDGRIAEDGFVSCHTEGRLLVADMVPAPDLDQFSWRATVLDADCVERPGTVVRRTIFSDAELWFILLPDYRWALRPGEGYDEPDEIVGDWQTLPDDTRTDHVTVRIQGAAPTYRGIVIDAPEGSCFTPGQVMFEFLNYGQADGPSNAMDYGAPLAVLSDCMEVGQSDVFVREDPDGPSFMRADDTANASNSMVFEKIADGEPGPIQRVADPSAYPVGLEGSWYQQGSGDPTIQLRWQGEVGRPFVGKTIGREGACPAPGTIIWEVTGPPTSAGTPATVDTYERTDFGCELQQTRDGHMRSGPDNIEIPFIDLVLDDETIRFTADLNLTLSGGNDDRRIGLAFLITARLQEAFGQAAFAGGGTPLYLATQANFPDGLAVAGLAGRTRGLTLLVDPSEPTVNAEILELVADDFDEIVVVGGEGVVPSSALPGPGEPGAPDRRLAGTNRFHTAQVLAEDGWPSGADTVYIATGANFPDALSGGAAASVEGAPVLLIDGERMPDETAAALTTLGPDEIIALGGEAVIPPSMITQLEAFAPVTRLAGSGRAETAAAVSAARFAGGSDQALVTSGDRFGEALLAASAAWAFDAPLLLVGQTVFPQATADELDRLGVEQVRLLAVDGSVTDSVINDLREALPPRE